MKSSRLEEYKKIVENMIKDVINLFRLKKLKKETNDATIKGIRNLFTLKKENKKLNAEYLETLEIFLSMKKKTVIK